MKLKLSINIMCILTVVIFSCSTSGDPDLQFEKVAGNYIEDYLKLYPESATRLGDHRYDHRLNDYSLAGVRKSVEMNRNYLRKLDKIEVCQLSQTNLTDYQILRQRIDKSIFSAEILKEHEWNPLIYNAGGAIYNIIARESAPLEIRLGYVQKRLEQIPEMLNQAKINLQNPPQIFTETAILRSKGTVTLIRDQLTEFVEQVPQMEAEFYPVRNMAVTALQNYIVWLENPIWLFSNQCRGLDGGSIFRPFHRPSPTVNVLQSSIHQ